MRLRMCQETRCLYRKAFNGSVLLYALHFGNYLLSLIMFHIWREGWAFLLWYVQTVLRPSADRSYLFGSRKSIRPKVGV
jgi:hypothetical protein